MVFANTWRKGRSFVRNILDVVDDGGGGGGGGGVVDFFLFFFFMSDDFKCASYYTQVAHE